MVVVERARAGCRRRGGGAELVVRRPRQRVERLHVVAHLVGGPGQGGGDAGAELLLEDRQDGTADADPRVAGVVVVRVVPGVEALDLAGGHRVVAGRRRAAAGRSGRRRGACRPATGRRNRGSGRGAPSRPGRRGCGRAARARRRAARAAARARRTCACRAAASGPCPSPTTSTRTVAVSSTPSATSWATTRAAWSAEPGCRPWSTVAPTTRIPSLCPSKTAADARASESAPPEQATTTVSPGSSPDSTPRTPRRQRRRWGGGSWCLVQHATDPAVVVAELGLRRQVRRLGPDGVELLHADLVDDARGRSGRRRGTAPSWRRGRAAGAGSGRGCRSPGGAW